MQELECVWLLQNSLDSHELRLVLHVRTDEGASVAPEQLSLLLQLSAMSLPVLAPPLTEGETWKVMKVKSFQRRSSVGTSAGGNPQPADLHRLWLPSSFNRSPLYTLCGLGDL